MALGIAKHLVTQHYDGQPSRAACGTYGHLFYTTEKPREVNCLNCRRTRKFKEASRKTSDG